jgi:hypothetical protein
MTLLFELANQIRIKTRIHVNLCQGDFYLKHLCIVKRRYPLIKLKRLQIQIHEEMCSTSFVQ